jgi:hypothetical protein
LSNVRKSNYWDLIALIVWSHYSEPERQDEKMIKIKENWYGKTSSGGSYSRKWDNPSHTEEGHVRTLSGIEIEFTRSDYTTHIRMDSENGALSYFAMRTDPPHKEVNLTNYNSLAIVNWMLNNHFYKLQ